MRQSKLVELLRTLSGRQLTRFREFLESPYFNRSGELLRFFEYLEPYGPEYSDPALE